MNERLDEITDRMEAIKLEQAELLSERKRIFVEEIEKMFDWDLLVSLEWHVAHTFYDQIHLRSIFSGDLKESYFNLQRKAKCSFTHIMKINDISVNIGSQGLIIIGIPFHEYLELAKKLNIVNLSTKLGKKMLRQTIEELQILEKLYQGE